MRQGTLYHRSTFVYKRTQQHLQVNNMYTYVAANALHYFERITETRNTKSSKDAEKFQAYAILLSKYFSRKLCPSDWPTGLQE